MEDYMAKEEISKDILMNRLKKIEGQAHGIQKMIENGRDCEDILTQLVAIRSAVESVGALVLHNFMHLCFTRREGDKETADVNSLARALVIWARVHIGE
jgi:DNA-binding FrmR family transcriptional regulator